MLLPATPEPLTDPRVRCVVWAEDGVGPAGACGRRRRGRGPGLWWRDSAAAQAGPTATHTHTHTHTHTYPSHTHIHTQACTHTHARTHALPTHTHTLPHAHRRISPGCGACPHPSPRVLCICPYVRRLPTSRTHTLTHEWGLWRNRASIFSPEKTRGAWRGHAFDVECGMCGPSHSHPSHPCPLPHAVRCPFAQAARKGRGQVQGAAIG